MRPQAPTGKTHSATRDMNLSWVLALGAALAACSDSTGPSEPRVGAVIVEASDTIVDIGVTTQLIATVLDTSGVVMIGRAVTWASSRPEVATVTSAGLVTALSAGQSVITATSGSKSGQATLRVRPGPCTADSAVPMSVGSAIVDSLAAIDCILMEAPYADAWGLTVTESMRLEITMSSSDFDALLVVTDLNLEPLAYNDDGGPATDARLVWTFAPGSYIVWATSVQVGATGRYTLETGPIEYTCTTHDITVGESVSGTLSPNTCQSDFGYVGDRWSLTLGAATTIDIVLRSTDFDALVWIEDDAGNMLDYDDDSGGGFDSRMIVSLAAGVYTIWASSFTGSESGAYTLTVAAAAPGATSGVGRVRDAERDSSFFPKWGNKETWRRRVSVKR